MQFTELYASFFTAEFFYQSHCKLRCFYPPYAMIPNGEVNDFASFQQSPFEQWETVQHPVGTLFWMFSERGRHFSSD